MLKTETITIVRDKNQLMKVEIDSKNKAMSFYCGVGPMHAGEPDAAVYLELSRSQIAKLIRACRKAIGK